MQLERARSVVAAREGLVVANSTEWGSCKAEGARVVVAQMEDGLMQLRRAKARERAGMDAARNLVRWMVLENFWADATRDNRRDEREGRCNVYDLREARNDGVAKGRHFGRKR